MNSNVLHSNAQVDQFILNNLVEVKETIAPTHKSGKRAYRAFGINDLWNIHRNAKLASERRRRA